MAGIGRIALILYGALMLMGGIMGFALKGSKPSLITGIISAVLLGGAYMLSRTQPRAGFGLGVVMALGLAIFFAMGTQKPEAFARSLGLCVLSILALVIFAAALAKGSR